MQLVNEPAEALTLVPWLLILGASRYTGLFRALTLLERRFGATSANCWYVVQVRDLAWRALH